MYNQEQIYNNTKGIGAKGNDYVTGLYESNVTNFRNNASLYDNFNESFYGNFSDSDYCASKQAHVYVNVTCEVPINYAQPLYGPANALVTPLGLRMYTGGGDQQLSNGSLASLPPDYDI
ncbi:hypothetical protein EVAR_12204_1 [Eumeta japonica]|uniref:Uncharacterized protein n=1 Tax=Eumeta variegata TaxID=151549 RepID=A0A4C1UIL7_EUMVA|nr:hypothetical protein EVAR_12204_1 [Eumeta japonica]